MLPPFLCGYKKGFSTQTALLGLAKKWKAKNILDTTYGSIKSI